ncbi:MAG: homoserine O-succinyltransferase [Chromatiales bacterium]|jgi:homoserine O-succinyltransferase
MPLIAHSELPTFKRLEQAGMTVLPPDRAIHQDFRELHVGLLNMMPDAALEATERQFFRLVGQSSQIAQFYIHPFTLTEIERSDKAQQHIDRYYDSFELVKEQGLDALIITGANVSQPDLTLEPFWKPLKTVFDWAYENVTSTLCSCLATHAVLEARYGKKRRPIGEKRWGVFSHEVVDRSHPLVHDVNTRFDVPHSRFNQIDREQFEQAGLHVLVESPRADVHLAVSEDGFRIVYFQGHPEYDNISLLKEYKREVLLYFRSKREDYPVFPENYFSVKAQAILTEYRLRLEQSKQNGEELPEFPEKLLMPLIDNTWHDTAEAVVENWVGKVYQLTSMDRKTPFMPGIDVCDPLNWLQK